MGMNVAEQVQLIERFSENVSRLAATEMVMVATLFKEFRAWIPESSSDEVAAILAAATVRSLIANLEK